ncbi:hypothetical protein IMCC9480_3134 [Oxalobacteraceae bacterium IMCC9480]|nr:hypothetical protein IMCC9480_3134 [Oxalobacteraceae bacterium IMCC9480]
MQKLNATLAPLWAAAQQNQNDADHRRQVDKLLDNAGKVSKNIIPEHLHQAGPERIRKVDAGDIARLRLGRSLALATRQLLRGGPGNQRLAVAASRGDCMTSTLGARDAALNGLRQYDALPTLAVLAQTGACDEHVSVAFELARALELPLSTMANDDNHSALVLHPELGPRAVVVDAWSTFPTSCLMEDSTFTEAIVMRRHQPGAASPGHLNLAIVRQLRGQLEQALGPLPILRARQQEYADNRPQEFAGLTSTRQIRDRLSELTLRDAATAISCEAKRRIIATDLLHGLNDSRFSDHSHPVWQQVQQRAQTATAPLLNALREATREEAAHSVQRRARRQMGWTGTMAITLDDIAKVDVEMTATALPALRDERLPSGNILYKADDGSRFSTTVAPQWIIDAAAKGWRASETLHFPDGYR